MAKLSCSRRLPRYRAFTPAADTESYFTFAVDRVIVFCIFDRHMIGDLVYNTKFPKVDLQKELFPQSESANPDKRSLLAPLLRRYKICMLEKPLIYSVRW